MSKRKVRFNIIMSGDPDDIVKSCRTYWGAKYWLLFIDPEISKDLSIVECTSVVI